MSILKAKCSNCNEIIKNKIYWDYGGVQRCYRCHLKNELSYLEAKYHGKRKWLKDTHIKELREMRNQISKLKNDLMEESKQYKPSKIIYYDFTRDAWVDEYNEIFVFDEDTAYRRLKKESSTHHSSSNGDIKFNAKNKWLLMKEILDSSKPPVGTVPENFYKEQRIKDLASAIYRYIDAGYFGGHYAVKIGIWCDELSRRINEFR